MCIRDSARAQLPHRPARSPRRYAGWDAEHRIAIRVVTSRAYHALFMRNMLVEPTAEEAANFVPDFTILNAGCFPANRCARPRNSARDVGANFGRRAQMDG